MIIKLLIINKLELDMNYDLNDLYIIIHDVDHHV